MAEPIVIKVTLDTREINRGAQEIARTLTNALDLGIKTARDAGRKMGQALSLGIETGLRDLMRVQRQVDSALDPARRHAAFETKERQHAQRIEEIQRRVSAQIQVIEARKQAQLDAIRERGVQKALADQRRLERATRDSAGGVDFLSRSIGRLSGAFGVLAAFGAVALFERIGRAALDAAINIDKQVNTLKALTGSAAAAEQRFAALIALAQKTPGLTTSLAATLDAQLRILDVTEQTINKLLPAIGRLNAVSPLGDPQQFASNLGQLISQGFERQDLKELVGQSPLAGQLIKEIFGVNNPTNAKAIREAARKLGIDTAEELFTAFAQAAENNQALRSVTESLGGQFDKLRDRLSVALAPIGEQIAKTLLPVFDDLVKSVEKYGASAAAVFRENRNDIIAAAKQIGILVVEVGKLTAALSKLPVINLIPEFLGRAAAETQDILSDPFGQLFGLEKGPKLLGFERELARIEAERKLPRLSTEPGVTSGLIETMKALADFRSGRSGKSGAGGGRDDGAASERQRQKTELERAVKDTDELRKQVAALRAGTGKLFDEELKLAQLEIEREKLKKEREQLQFIRAREAAGLPLPPQLPGGIGFSDEVKRNIQQQAARGFSLREFAGPSDISRISREAADADAAQVAGLRADEARQRLRIEEVRIQNQVNAGLLTEAEARRALLGVEREQRDEIIARLEAQREAASGNTLEVLRITEQIEQMRLLGVELSSAQRFMRGFGSATESVGDAFERFGQNVSRALTNTRDLLNGLKQAVLGFFNDLLGQSLQNLMRSIFAPLLGGLGGGGTAGGGIGGLFRTPGTFPANLASAFAGGGGGLSAPPSISQSIFGGLGGIFSGGGAARASSGIDQFFGASVPRTAGRIGGGFSLSGIGQSLAAAAPSLGLSFGSALGGTSPTGRLLGGIGGLAVGGFAAGSAGLIGTGAIAGLLSNPITAIVGGALLIGGIFLGKASQRRKDEEASGEMIRQANTAIEQLRQGIRNDQIEGSQARGIFDNQILGTFIQQINTLKTKSVRESRLTNTVREFRQTFERLIPPEIAAQEERRRTSQRNAAIDSRLIPQFAIGGIVPGLDLGRDSVLSMLRPNEMVLTVQHQAAIKSLAGADVFNRAGVPGVQQSATFQTGGIAPAASSPRSDSPVIIYLDAVVDAEGIFIKGGSTESGRQVIVKQIDATDLKKGRR